MKKPLAVSIISIFFCLSSVYGDTIKGQENAVLTDAPEVPMAITRKFSTKVIVNLEVKEVKKRMADGVEYLFWTFGGNVPGKFIRVREGDEVEFHLSNHPSSKMPHNIDLHAVTGPGGGAASSFTAPGHTSVFSFKVINPGLYVYHCATAPVGMHIANGMYGLILVEPKEGLPKVDKEYYVMQSEFYTKGKNGQKGFQLFSQDKAFHEQPEYVVFNGSVGALAGDNAIKAKVGEKVRLYVGNGGPNLVSSFHVIGEIFDKVYIEGGTKSINENVQTTLVPPGGSSIVEFKVEVPGTFIIVDHSIFRTFNKGSLGMLKVEGPEDKVIYSGKTADDIYLPVEASAIHKEDKTMVSNELGKKVFENTCMACHQADGKGLEDAFPPLAKSDFLNADKKRVIQIVLGGKEGKITVNGVKWDGVMPPQELGDEEVAAAINYVYSSWGNKGYKVTPAEVKAERAKLKK